MKEQQFYDLALKIAEEDNYNQVLLKKKNKQTYLEWEEGCGNAVGGINLTKLYKTITAITKLVKA